MTVIAWDGKVLAADKRAVSSGMQTTCTKIFRLDSGEVLAFSGDLGSGLMMLEWFRSGADLARFPECQKSSELWTRLVVAKANEPLRCYEQQPVALTFEDKYLAFGSGRDYAMAAMYCGKNAVEAVVVASYFDVGCGNGVDSMEPG